MQSKEAYIYIYMTKKAVTIGAGIAGLSTGFYAQKNGFSSEIYEMLSKWNLNRRSLGYALEKLLSESTLRENMLRLKSLQDKADGSAVAAGEIIKFLGAANGRRR